MAAAAVKYKDTGTNTAAVDHLTCHTSTCHHKRRLAMHSSEAACRNSAAQLRNTVTRQPCGTRNLHMHALAYAPITLEAIVLTCRKLLCLLLSGNVAAHHTPQPDTLTVVLHQHPHSPHHGPKRHHVREEEPEPRPAQLTQQQCSKYSSGISPQVALNAAAPTSTTQHRWSAGPAFPAVTSERCSQHGTLLVSNVT